MFWYPCTTVKWLIIYIIYYIILFYIILYYIILYYIILYYLYIVYYVYIYISVSLQSNLQLCSRNAWKVSAVCGCRASSTGSKRCFQRSADKRSPCSLVAWWGERVTFKPWLVSWSGWVGGILSHLKGSAESFRSHRRWEKSPEIGGFCCRATSSI